MMEKAQNTTMTL